MTRKRKSPTPLSKPKGRVPRLLAIVRIGDTSIVIRDDGRIGHEAVATALVELLQQKGTVK